MPADELTQPAGAHVDQRGIMLAGEIEVLGRMPWSSNATFLVSVRDGDDEARAIYKPGRGERPLWDFPDGLYRREVAAFELSEAMGVGVVPPTVLRAEAPLGVGSLQWFVEADFEQHYFVLHEHRPELHDQFRAIATFDLLANNTDRKSGHCLLGPDDRIWAIDNGLCFAEDDKLRTVIWEFGGEPIPAHLLEGVQSIVDAFPPLLTELLHPEECRAVRERACQLLDRGCFPIDRTGRRYPWPLV